jgi:hypothetical protein
MGRLFNFLLRVLHGFRRNHDLAPIIVPVGELDFWVGSLLGPEVGNPERCVVGLKMPYYL